MSLIFIIKNTALYTLLENSRLNLLMKKARHRVELFFVLIRKAELNELIDVYLSRVDERNIYVFWPQNHI